MRFSEGVCVCVSAELSVRDRGPSPVSRDNAATHP